MVWASLPFLVDMAASRRSLQEALVSESEPLATLCQAIFEVVAGIEAALTETGRSKSQAERDGQARAGEYRRVNLTRLETLVQLFTAWATNDKVP